MILVSPILVFVFIMSILNLLREVFNVIRCFKNLVEYSLSDKRTLLLWCSISYIITFLIFAL